MNYKNLTIILCLLTTLTLCDIKTDVAKFLWKLMANETLKTYPQLTGPSHGMATKIFEKLNEYRKSLNLEILTWNEDVYILTLNHTYYMIEKGEISHDDFGERVTGYGASNENVAMFGGSTVDDESGAEKFFNMWKNSSGHDKNMKSTAVNQGAVGVVKSGNSYYSTMINVNVKA